jgi:NitT/TauT family transport system permease protein
MKKIILPMIPLVLLCSICEILVQRQVIPSYILPAPSHVFTALTINSSDLWIAMKETTESSVIGFLTSLIVGMTLAILFSTSKKIEETFYPYAVFFQTVPIIAIAPLLVIWFGYGLPTVIASSFIVSIFPVIANTLIGLHSTEKSFLDLFDLYGATSKDKLFKLKLPFALPSILAGARISSGLAVIGAIVGEFIAGGGLGGIVDVARTQQRIDKVFAAVLLASIVGLVFFALINLISHLTLNKWHASEKTQKG